jgi:hypothetical protein
VRIGAFEINDPIPDLNEPYLFAILRPWIDVNNVGSLTLNGLETQFGAKELGKLARPGQFYDFTRYRPTLYFEEGIRRISIPNTTLRYARREGGNDLLFLRLLEPHALAEVYVHSVLRLLKALKVKKYCLLQHVRCGSSHPTLDCQWGRHRDRNRARPEEVRSPTQSLPRSNEHYHSDYPKGV